MRHCLRPVPALLTSLLLLACADDSSTAADDTDADTTTGDATTSTATTVSTATTTSSGSSTTLTEGSSSSTSGVDESSSSTTGGQRTPFDDAVDGIGGIDALEGLSFLEIQATGNRAFSYQSTTPADVPDLADYAYTVSFDLDEDNIRIDDDRNTVYQVFQFVPPDQFTIVINGDVGALPAPVGAAPAGPLASNLVGARRMQLRLLNPHFYLRDGLLDPDLVGDGGVEDYEGRPHDVVTFEDPVAEVRLFVDQGTGLISKLETLEAHTLVRDNTVEVRYTDWVQQGDLMFPNTVEAYYGGALLHDETRTMVDTDAAFDAGWFDLPPEADGAVADPVEFEFGMRSAETVESFWNLGFYFAQTNITSTQLAEDVWFIQSNPGPGTYNSLLIRTDEGLVLLEAALSPEYGDALMAEIESLYPGVPVTHIIQSHFHKDHAAGVRSVVASGATLVVGDGIGGFWEDTLAAESTVSPDTLAGRDLTPTIIEIDNDGTFVIDSTDVDITAYHGVATGHASDMLVVVVETMEETFVYESDLYNAGQGFTVVLGGHLPLFNEMRDIGVLDDQCAAAAPTTIVPSHGVAQGLDASLAELGMLMIDVGCP